MAVSDEDLVARVERLAGIGSCSGASYSPDGKRLALTSDLSGSPQVWVVSAEGGWPHRVTLFPDQVTSSRWSPTSDLIAVEVAPGGGLDQQVYVVGPDGSGLRRITRGGAENNRLVRWSRDGRTLYVASNKDEVSAFESYAVDIASGVWTRITKRGGITDHLVADTTRIRRELGYREVVAREQGRRRTLAWYAETPAADPKTAGNLDYDAEDAAVVTIRGAAVH